MLFYCFGSKENLYREIVRRKFAERAQARGRLPPDIDLLQLVISMVALTVFPLAFPQMTKLASGLAPTDPRFRRKRAEFLRWLGERLSADPPSVPSTNNAAAASRRRGSGCGQKAASPG